MGEVQTITNADWSIVLSSEMRLNLTVNNQGEALVGYEEHVVNVFCLSISLKWYLCDPNKIL